MMDRCAVRGTASPYPGQGLPRRGAFARSLGRLLTLTVVCLLFLAGNAHAEGLLRFIVRDQATGAPVAGASVFLDDPTGSEFRKTLLTGEDGTITSEPLAAHVWQVTAIKVGYERTVQEVTVVDDQTVDVTVLLRPLPPTLIELITKRLLIDPRDTANTTRRTPDFLTRFPVGIGDRQDIFKGLRSAPGFVENSLNQTHVRGDQKGVATYLNGFLLPAQPQGQLGHLLLPTIAQEFDIKHGGLAPEFGGEAGAVVNIRPRSGTRTPILEGLIADGGFSTSEAYLTFGNKQNLPGAKPDSQGIIQRTFSYFVTGSLKSTRTGAEAPQSGNQVTNNRAERSMLYGKFDLGLTDTASLTGIFNVSDSDTGIGDRLGLSDSYQNFGQGFGFLGRLPESSGLRSQAAELQDIRQKDNNQFTLIQLNNRITPESNITLSFGVSNSKMRLQNNSPSGGDLRNLPADSSVDYNPTTLFDYDQFQASADYTLTRGDHSLKAGVVYNTYDSEEIYRFVPGSQLALNALATLDPRLVPSNGSFTGAVDALGNRVYALNQDGTPVDAPNFRVGRDGYYGALYLQDTWRLNAPFTLNYGFRLDTFRMSRDGGGGSYTESEISPRLNMSMLLPSRGFFGFLGSTPTVFRASYNRLFTRPPLGQGSFLGDAVRPQVADQYEVSVERQFDLSQTLKLALYTRDIENFLNAQALIPGTQLGSGTTVFYNAGKANAHGLELTYNYEPGEGQPLSGYLVYSNNIVRLANANQRNSLGQIVGTRLVDHDQLHTISAGAAYTLADGTSLGLNIYYGSGLFSSETPGGDRDSILEVNFRAATNPRFVNKAFGLEFAVENLFDSQSRYNFRAPYEGTRFQTGRRILVGIFGKL
jgi:hypothetical protein